MGESTQPGNSLCFAVSSENMICVSGSPVQVLCNVFCLEAFHDPHNRRQGLVRSGPIILFQNFYYPDDKLLALSVTSGKHLNCELNLAVPDILFGSSKHLQIHE